MQPDKTLSVFCLVSEIVVGVLGIAVLAYVALAVIMAAVDKAVKFFGAAGYIVQYARDHRGRKTAKERVDCWKDVQSWSDRCHAAELETERLQGVVKTIEELISESEPAVDFVMIDDLRAALDEVA